MSSNKLILSVLIAALSLTVTACSTLGISDGSLDYRKKKIIAPLNITGDSVNVFRPLYSLPAYEEVVDSSALTNNKGNRFVMPRSIISTLSNKALTENEKGVPVLQLQDSLPIAMAKVASALKKSNFGVLNSQNNSYFILTHNQLKGKRLLRFNTKSSTTNVILTNVNSTLAEVKEARFVLNEVYKGLQ